MAFIFKYTLEATTPVYEQVKAAAVAIAVNSCIADNDSGYADDATAATSETVIGVADKAVDNSGGAAGDLSIPTIVNHSAVYEVGTADTMAAAYTWLDVANSAANLTVISNTGLATAAGVSKIRKMISASLVLVNFNWGND